MRPGPFVIVALASYLLYLLPRQVVYFLLLWIVASVPIGIVMGHIMHRGEPEDEACSGPEPLGRLPEPE
jgi:hypothetical protein